MRLRTIVPTVAAIAALTCGVIAAGAATAAPGPAVPDAVPAAAHTWDSPIGVLAHNNAGSGHFCTGSVVNSPHHNIVLTAAHCVVTDVNLKNPIWFLPDFANGSPNDTYGRWQVSRVIIPSGYVQLPSSPYDYAFLVLKPFRGGNAQDRTGALSPVANVAVHNTPATIAGYNKTMGSLSWCQSKINVTHFSPPLNQYEYGNCAKTSTDPEGLWDGTSGGPFIETGTTRVIGLMGGYEQGGSTRWTEYSALLGNDFSALYNQAKAA
jgi:hypothetical protein